jgi:putative addiction module component (TIGR02574 family)
MSQLMTALGLDRLSVPERLQLLQELSDSLGADAPESPLSDAQKQELDRRLAALDADPSAVRPWDEVEARILARLKR